MDRISIKGEDMYVLTIEELDDLLTQQRTIERKLAFLFDLLNDVTNNYCNTPDNAVFKLIKSSLQELEQTPSEDNTEKTKSLSTFEIAKQAREQRKIDKKNNNLSL